MIQIRAQTGGQLLWFCVECGWRAEATVDNALVARNHPCGEAQIKYGLADAVLVGPLETLDDRVKYPYSLTATWVSDIVEVP